MAWPALPKGIEYALKALLCLAQTHERPLRAREIARCVAIPTSQAAKTLYLLTWAGFARSRRGSAGGFWLARAPEHILVGQVIKFFQPPLAKDPTAWRDPLLRAWWNTAAGTHSAWEKLTLADLLHRIAENRQSAPYVCPRHGKTKPEERGPGQ